MNVDNIASIDFETASVVDLTRAGVSRYVRDLHTFVWCLAYQTPAMHEPAWWAIGDGGIPKALGDHLAQGGILSAWNAGFEFNIWHHLMVPNYGWPEVPQEQWLCTMASAAYAGLPGALDVCAEALQLPIRKDAAGKQLMLKMAGPANYRDRELDPRIPPQWHANNLGDLGRLIAYCMQDVDVERMILRRLPVVPPRERLIWSIDQKMNRRGITLDVPLMRKMMPLALRTLDQLNLDLTDITNREVLTTTRVLALRRWANQQPEMPDGYALDDLQANTVQNLLIELEAQRQERSPLFKALKMRHEGRHNSHAKIERALGAICDDGRLRDLLRYYGAGRTGRWSGAGGSGVQPQNMARPARRMSKVIPEATADLLRGMAGSTLERKYRTSPLEVIASCIRGVFRAAPGKLLVCGDFAQIEARVFPWLADEQDILDVFRAGQEDIYDHVVQQVGGTERQLGKVMALSGIYGVGGKKFAHICTLFGVPMDETTGYDWVYRFRASRPDMVQFWYDLDRAFRQALGLSLGAHVAVGHVAFHRTRVGIAMQLPSGRDLHYIGAHVDAHDDIRYFGVDQKTKRWGLLKAYGAKFGEHASQAIARDVMAEAMIALEPESSLDLLVTVHDEIVAETEAWRADAVLDHMLRVMRQTPAWAPGLPIDAAGYVAERYRKGA